MEVSALTVKNFRNLKELRFLPGPGVNVIYGENGQGKTNLLEAIWLFTGAGSFRQSKLHEMITIGQEGALLSLEFSDAQRAQTGKIKLGARRETQFNQISCSSREDAAGHFYSVVFSPSDLNLIQGGPRYRRQFGNNAISQLRPQYGDYLDRYQRVLDQRNSLLKEMFRQSALKETLFPWDEQLARLGTIISLYRKDYFRKLNRFGQPLYQGLSGGKESFSISYRSSAFPNLELLQDYSQEAVDFYLERLAQSLESDCKLGTTTVGVHRDDLEISVNRLSVRTFGSQGQQRSSVLALKFAEAAMIRRITGEQPVMLLDDVMSELDASRQKYILNHIEDTQVFLTCCDPASALRLLNGKTFRVCGGELTEENAFSKTE